MSAVDDIKSRIILMSTKANARVMEKVQMDIPNEFTEEQSRELLRRYLASEIGDSEAVALAWLHLKPGNNHAHVNIVDGLETKKSAKARAAIRSENDTENKTRIRRRNHLRYGELFKRLPKTLGDKDSGEKTKAYLRRKWAETVNEYAREIGVAVHFEHRSFEGRGIVFEPTKHEGPATRALVKKFQTVERIEAISGTAPDLHDAAIAAFESPVIEANRQILIRRVEIENDQNEAELWINDSIQSADRTPPSIGIRLVKTLHIGSRAYMSVTVKSLTKIWRKGVRRALDAGRKIRTWLYEKSSQISEQSAVTVTPTVTTVSAISKSTKRAPAYDRALNSYIAVLDAKTGGQQKPYVALQKAIDHVNRRHSVEDETVFMRSLIEMKRPDLLGAHDQNVAEITRRKNTQNVPSTTNSGLGRKTRAGTPYDLALDAHIAALEGSSGDPMRTLVMIDTKLKRSEKRLTEDQREERLREMIFARRPDLVELHDKLVAKKYLVEIGWLDNAQDDTQGHDAQNNRSKKNRQR